MPSFSVFFSYGLKNFELKVRYICSNSSRASFAKQINKQYKKTTDQLEFRGRDTENREEFEINTSRPTTQNNLIPNAGFTKRQF